MYLTLNYYIHFCTDKRSRFHNMLHIVLLLIATQLNRESTFYGGKRLFLGAAITCSQRSLTCPGAAAAARDVDKNLCANKKMDCNIIILFYEFYEVRKYICPYTGGAVKKTVGVGTMVVLVLHYQKILKNKSGKNIKSKYSNVHII